MAFPIDQEHTTDLLIGLFTTVVREIYQRVAAESGLSMPFDANVKRQLFAQAILETTRSFPVSIRGRFEQAADAMATELAAGRPLTP
jgi:hypothetical protein